MKPVTPAAAIGFATKTALVQAIAATAVVVSWPVFQSIPVSLLLATAVAFGLAAWIGLPLPWKCFNVILPVAAASSLAIEIPAWIFLIPLVLLAAVYAPAIWTRVPYYPTPTSAYALILAELPTDRPFTFIDIGCGFGDLLTFLSQRRPNGRFIGVEVGPLPYLVSALRSTRHSNLSIAFQDMWRLNLGEYDFVYTFLSPAAMPRVWEKASREMNDGALFITNSFPVPADPSEVLDVKDERASKLYLHRIRPTQSPTMVGNQAHA